MEVQIKKAIKAGNSSAVVLPRAWLNKEVRIELIKKTHESILFDVIDIVKENIKLEEVIGVYLVGSYARGEESKESDIDVLVITKDTDKEMITKGIYNILIVSSGLLKQKLMKDLFPIGPMIKEAKPILNSDYLDSIDVRITRKNIKWYLDTTGDKLKIIKKVLEKAKNKGKKNINNVVAYTLALRIRTLCIMGRLIENKNYSKKEFVKLINKISQGASAYESYLSVKNNMEEGKGISISEAERLYEYLRMQLAEIKRKV